MVLVMLGGQDGANLKTACKSSTGHAKASLMLEQKVNQQCFHDFVGAEKKTLLLIGNIVSSSLELI